MVTFNAATIHGGCAGQCERVSHFNGTRNNLNHKVSSSPALTGPAIDTVTFTGPALRDDPGKDFSVPATQQRARTFFHGFTPDTAANLTVAEAALNGTI